MTTVNFKLRNVATGFACLAVAMMTACGSGSGNKQQGSTSTEQATAVKEVSGSGKWVDNHFTKQIPKLDFAINSDGVDVSETSTILRFSDAKPTKEQINAYWTKVKAAGFTNNVSEVDDEYGLSYYAKNAAGYDVNLTNRSITIKKE